MKLVFPDPAIPTTKIATVLLSEVSGIVTTLVISSKYCNFYNFAILSKNTLQCCQYYVVSMRRIYEENALYPFVSAYFFVFCRSYFLLYTLNCYEIMLSTLHMTGFRLLYEGMEFLCSIPCQVFVLLYNQNEHYHGYVKRLQVEFGKNRKILVFFIFLKKWSVCRHTLFSEGIRQKVIISLISRILELLSLAITSRTSQTKIHYSYE